MVPFVFIAAVLAVILVVIFLQYRAEKERVAGMAASSADLGFTFAEKLAPELLAELRDFPLFKLGRAKKAYSAMRGTTADLDAAVFDYKYTIGGGKNQQTVKQTVARFRAVGLDLPPFALKPETFWHRVGAKLFSTQDIDFDTHPKFSKQFLLQGSSEARIRDVFTVAVLDALETMPGWCVEAGGDDILVYRPGVLVKPAEIRDFLADGFAVLTPFRPAAEYDEGSDWNDFAALGGIRSLDKIG